MFTPCRSAVLRNRMFAYVGVFSVAVSTVSLSAGAQMLDDLRVFLAISPIHHDREYEPGGDHRTQFLYLGQPLQLIVAIENVTQSLISVETPDAWFSMLSIAIAPGFEGDASNVSGPWSVISRASWSASHQVGRVQSDQGGEVVFEPETSDVVRLSFNDEFMQTLGAGSYALRISLPARVRGPDVNRQKAFETTVGIRIVDPNVSSTHSMEYAARRAQAAFREHRATDTQAAVEELIRLNPSSVLGLIWLGDLAKLAGNCPDARKYYQAAMSSIIEKKDRWSIKTHVAPVAAQRSNVIQARLAQCG